MSSFSTRAMVFSSSLLAAVVISCNGEDVTPTSPPREPETTTTTTADTSPTPTESRPETTTTDTSPGSTETGTEALLVVADGGALSSGDTVIKDILTGLNYRVTVDSDDDVERVSGFDVVVIVESSDSNTLGTKYKDSSMPLVVLENGAWDDHNYISAESGTLTSVTRLDIGDDSHEISGGLKGSELTFLREAADVKTVTDDMLATSAQVALSAAGSSRRIGVAYEEGTTVHRSDVTESRRVLLGFTDDAVANLTSNGEWIIEQSIRWATGSSVGADFSSNGKRILFVFGTSFPMPDADRAMADRMREILGYKVTAREALNVTTEDADGFDVVVLSKTVESVDIGDEFKSFTGGFWTFEDNIQAISVAGTPMMAFIDLTDPAATDWHSPTTHWHIESGAATDLSAGLSGPVQVYDTPRETTYAPATGDNSAALPDTAVRVGVLTGDADGRFPYYAYESGATLADGSPAAGRRVFFGLYEHEGTGTFQFLTTDGLALFDASLHWAGARN